MKFSLAPLAVLLCLCLCLCLAATSVSAGSSDSGSSGLPDYDMLANPSGGKLIEFWETGCFHVETVVTIQSYDTIEYVWSMVWSYGGGLSFFFTPKWLSSEGWITLLLRDSANALIEYRPGVLQGSQWVESGTTMTFDMKFDRQDNNEVIVTILVDGAAIDSSPQTLSDVYMNPTKDFTFTETQHSIAGRTVGSTIFKTCAPVEEGPVITMGTNAQGQSLKCVDDDCQVFDSAAGRYVDTDSTASDISAPVTANGDSWSAIPGSEDQMKTDSEGNLQVQKPDGTILTYFSENCHSE